MLCAAELQPAWPAQVMRQYVAAKQRHIEALHAALAPERNRLKVRALHLLLACAGREG